MQTFLPYIDFQKSAAVLDKKRAWKQVVECKQILCALNYEHAPEDWKATSSWLKRPYLHHPAVKMWKGYEHLLALYYNVFLEHALQVLHIQTQMQYIHNEYIEQYEKLLSRPEIEASPDAGKFPFWFFDADFHRAYRARLIKKDPGFYRDKFREDEGFNDGEYLWPDMETGKFYRI